MTRTAIARVMKKQIGDLVSSGNRLDGRGLSDHRRIQLKEGIIEQAEGSAHLYLGKTEVMVGIKIEIGKPFPDTPNEGVLTVNVELTPLASPDFEPGPPSENAIEIARVVDRGIRESKAIALEKLCIEPGKQVFVVFVDIYVLNDAGNIIDASAMAALSALLNSKLPNYEVEEGQVRIKSGYTPLTVKNYPIAITFVKIADKFLIDACMEEEQVMDARLTITIEKDGKICAMQKGDSGYLAIQQILDAAEVAKEKAKELRSLLVKG